LREEPSDTHVIYIDDDWIYHPTMVQVLYEKSLQHPNCAVAFSGAVFRNYFRQVGHTERTDIRFSLCNPVALRRFWGRLLLILHRDAGVFWSSQNSLIWMLSKSC
jgi:hypothetical protein